MRVWEYKDYESFFPRRMLRRLEHILRA